MQINNCTESYNIVTIEMKKKKYTKNSFIELQRFKLLNEMWIENQANLANLPNYLVNEQSKIFYKFINKTHSIFVLLNNSYNFQKLNF